MATVGVRELKARLSHYLRRIKEGERIVVTTHGEPIAVMVPAPEGEIDERFEAMLQDGTAHWNGGKPRGARRPVKIRGRSFTFA
ncbi:MAG: type II toxin-antitoxin system prevent-host-death family antitoxin [Armatimonadota bacterium]|nr:type II toxin-antitoxin system prevent-host-death family antitoxin [Armatimonadota bacterium]